MRINPIQNSQTFDGRTKIFAMTDSHQESRKTCRLLSEVMRRGEGDKNVLLLNCGDFFKGVYPRDLEKENFLLAKKLMPDMEMAVTVGNNDFGFSMESLNYLINTIKDFTANGIRVVCANIFNSEGKRPDWLKPYTVVERDGDKSLITGFCINNINTTKFGIVAKNQSEVFDEVISAIEKEKPDNFIILNHDHSHSSNSLYEEFKNLGHTPDLIIGGHDHDPVPPDYSRRILYPEAFSKNMFIMDLVNENKHTELSGIELVENSDLEISPVFESELTEYEKTSGLLDNIAPRILNLTKRYSEPCALGSFLADKMMEMSGSDIAFFSTGFLMMPLEYGKGGFINNYDFKKTISADNTLATVNLSAKELREVFQNAFRTYDKIPSNPKFLQCSGNVKVEIKKNFETNEWKVINIFVDGEPISENRTYKCCIDSYIANGGQNFRTLQDAEKTKFIQGEKAITISQILMFALKEAPQKYKEGDEYQKYTVEIIK